MNDETRRCVDGCPYSEPGACTFHAGRPDAAPCEMVTISEED